MSSNIDTRKAIQAKQDAANAAAAKETAKIEAQKEAAVQRQYYVTDPNNTGFVSTATSPQGKLLEQLYRESGVVFDKGGNVIYNPADLGSGREIAARRAQGLPAPTFGGRPSDQYINSLHRAGLGDTAAIQQKKRLQMEQQEKAAEKKRIDMQVASLRSEITNLEKEIAARPDRIERYSVPGRANLTSTRTVSDPDKSRMVVRLSSLQRDLTELEQTQKNVTMDLVNISSGLGVIKKQEMTAFVQPQARPQREPKSARLLGPQGRAAPAIQKQLQYQQSIQRRPKTMNLQELAGATTQTGTKASGAKAGIKSVIPPIQNRELRGSDVTARDYFAVKSGKKMDPAFTITTRDTIVLKDVLPKESFASIPGTGQKRIFLGAAPPRPRELTQSEVDALSADQYKEYRKGFDTWNAYVAQENERIAGENVRIGTENQLIKQQNREIARQNISLRNQTKQQIRELKEQGFENIFIETKQGGRAVPIEQAYRALVTTPDIVAFGGASKTITQDQSGRITEEYRKAWGIEQPKLRVGAPPAAGGPVQETLYGLDALKSKNPVVQAGRGVWKELVGGFAGISNLEKQGVAAVQEAITGRQQLGVPQYDIPRNSAPGEIVGGAISGTIQAALKRDPVEFEKGIKKGYDEAARLAGEQGAFETAGSVFGFLFPVGPGAAKSIPLRGASVVDDAGKAFYRGLSVGYKGEKPVIGFKGGKPVLGEPRFTAQELEQIVTPLEQSRGFETGTRSALTTKIVTSDETLDALQKAGVYTADDVKLIRAAREGARSVEKLKSKAVRDELPDQPWKNLLAGKQTQAQIDYLKQQQGRRIGRMGNIKGSSAEIPQVEKQFMVQAGDVDVDVSSLIGRQVSKAEKFAEGNVQILQPTSQAEQIFVRRGRKVVTGERGEPFWSFRGLEEYVDFARGRVIHGSNRPAVESIVEGGVDLSKGRRPLFFATPTVKVARTFARKAQAKEGGGRAFAQLEFDRMKVLQFKDIPKRDRAGIVSDDWEKFQDNLIQYAKERGYSGATKPYHSPDVGAPKYELIMFDESAIRPIRNIPPTGFSIRPGTERKVAEYLAHGDPDLDIAGQQSKGSMVYGIKRKKETVRSGGLRFVGLRSQTLDRMASIGSVQSPKTQGSTIKSGLQVGVPEFRSGDVYHGYADLVTAAGQLKKSPKTYSAGKAAERAAADIREVYERRGFDFGEYFKKPLPEKMQFEKAPSLAGSVGRQSGRIGPALAAFLSRPSAPAGIEQKPESGMSVLGRQGYSSIERESQRQVNSITRIMKPSDNSVARMVGSTGYSVKAGGASMRQSAKSLSSVTKGSIPDPVSKYVRQISQSSISSRNPIQSLRFQSPFPSSSSDSGFNAPGRSVPSLPSRYNPVGSTPSLGSPLSPKSPLVPLSPGSPLTIRPPSVPGSPGYPTYPLKPIEFPPTEYPVGYPPLGAFGFNPALFNTFARDLRTTKRFYQTTYESADPNIKYLEGFTKFQRVSRSPKIFKELERIDRRAQDVYYGFGRGRSGRRGKKKSKSGAAGKKTRRK